MKKLLLTFTCSFVSLFAKTQPVLNSNEMLAFGSALHFKYSSSFSTIDTTIQGTNATWNFTGIVNNATIVDLVDTMVNPSTTPYGALFPTANYAYKEQQGAAIGYRYFNKTSSKMERVGSFTTGANTYNDPQIEYVFPLQLNATSSDTWDNTNSSFGGTYSITCIGYGTLMLPSHTYTNALMVRAWVTEGSLYSIPIYFWYSSDNGAILLSYIVGDGLFIASNILYLHSSSFVIGIEENNFLTGIKFNNPVKDNFHLSFQSTEAGGCTYFVFNSLGEAVLSGKFYVELQTQQDVTVDFSSLHPGIYIFKMESDRSAESVRSIKLVKME